MEQKKWTRVTEGKGVPWIQLWVWGLKQCEVMDLDCCSAKETSYLPRIYPWAKATTGSERSFGLFLPLPETQNRHGTSGFLCPMLFCHGSKEIIAIITPSDLIRAVTVGVGRGNATAKYFV